MDIKIIEEILDKTTEIIKEYPAIDFSEDDVRTVMDRLTQFIIRTYEVKRKTNANNG